MAGFWGSGAVLSSVHHLIHPNWRGHVVHRTSVYIGLRDRIAAREGGRVTLAHIQYGRRHNTDQWIRDGHVIGVTLPMLHTSKV